MAETYLNSDVNNPDTVGQPDPQAPSMQDALSGNAPAPPPTLNGGQPATPAYAGNINGETGKAIPNAPPVNKWERISQAVLLGLSGGAGAKNFGQGLTGGAKAVIQQQQVDKENQQRQQQLAMEQQRTMDSHQMAQAQLATAHIQQQKLAAEYNTMPKTTQDILDQVMYKQGSELQADANAKNVYTGSYSDALTRSQAEMTQKGENGALNVRVLKNPDGSFSVWDVASPDKLNDKPKEVVFSVDLTTGKPITKTYAPGTISYAQANQIETQAAANIAAAHNQLALHKKQGEIDAANAGTKAYNEESGRLKAQGSALGSNGNLSPNEIVGGMLDGSVDITKIFGNRGNSTQRAQYVAEAKRRDPNFTMQSYEQRQKMYNELANTQPTHLGGQISSFNTFLKHAGDAADQVDTLRNTQSPLINKPLNWIRSNVAGSPVLPAVEAAQMAVKDEFMTFIKAGHATSVDEQKQIDMVLSQDSSPAQIEGALKQLGKTGIFRLDSINNGYKRIIKKGIPDLIDPQAQSAIDRLGLTEQAGMITAGGSGAPAPAQGTFSPNNPFAKSK